MKSAFVGSKTQKGIALFLALALPLLSAGCATGAVSIPPQPAPSTAVSSNPPAGNASAQSAGALPDARFDTAEIQGKVRGACTGEGNTLLVAADQLCLYDCNGGGVTAAVPFPLDGTVSLLTFSGGYMAVGWSNSGDDSHGSLGGITAGGAPGGLLCIRYDSGLRETARIDINALFPPEDVFAGAANVAVSPDGASLAIALPYGLYRYDIAKQSLTTLLDLSQSNVSNGLDLVTIGQLSFVSGGNALAFIGESFPVGRTEAAESLTTYGSIRTDGTQLQIFQRDGYAVGDNLLALDDLLLLPEDFTKAQGELLAHTISTGEERVYSLSTPGEGRDGVFLSDRGDYFATAKLGDSLTIRIYERANGKLLHEETANAADPLYFSRVPMILLLDDSRTCIALLGTRQAELDTKSVCFGF